MGVDTIISTVTGNAQLRLIEAAVACRVRRFAPAEFEGQPGLRAQGDPLDRGRAAALALLQHYRGHIQSTVFVCGILYERFAVEGMRKHGIGVVITPFTWNVLHILGNYANTPHLGHRLQQRGRLHFGC